jgi:DNA polymerase-3 subunit gamma/tau
MADERYLVLARKWRPRRFEDVVGQEHITRTLRNAITSGRIHHAFLFIGSRGIGKTTTARILAMALNCSAADGPTPEPCGVCDNCKSITAGNHIDIIEIDGASNNGVDDVREIRDNIRMVPNYGRYKVYIIDEVHQLSPGAFNALLKTLEEPPSHAIFILATTEIHKIPATIVSRCQRYDFRRVGIVRLMELLREILDREGLKATDEALHAIARAAEGGVRDAESILDELITYADGEITYQDVFDVLGLVDWDIFHGLSEAILRKDIVAQLEIVERIVTDGKDLTQFIQDILRYYRNLLVCKTANDASLLHLPDDEIDTLRGQTGRYSLSQLIRMVEEFAKLTAGYESQLAQRIALESLLIRITKLGVGVSIDTVLEKLAALESGLALGAAPPPTADPPDAGAPAHAPAAPAIARRPEPTLAPIVVPKAEPVAVQPKPAPEQAKPAPEKPAAEKPEPIAPKPEAPKPEPAPAKPVAEVAVVPSGVTSNPLVADVIDVFKGHVVAVRSVE